MVCTHTASKESVRECLTQEVSLKDGFSFCAVTVLAAPNSGVHLSRAEERLVKQLEQSMDRSSEMIFHVISTALESRDAVLDHARVKHGLNCHCNHTLNELATLLYKGDASAAAAMKADLIHGGEDRELALATMSEALLEALQDAHLLKAATRILIKDPKNSALKVMYFTAVDLINEVQRVALGIFQKSVQQSQSQYIAPQIDFYSKRSGKGHGPDGDILLTEGKETRLIIEKPLEAAVQAVEITAAEKKIHDLREKLRRLLDEAMAAHKRALEGPAELRYAAAVERNQDQAEAIQVKAELRDAERDQKWPI